MKTGAQGGGIAEAFASWLAAGGNRIGEVAIARIAPDRFALTHWEEAQSLRQATGGGPLEEFRRPEEARKLAMYDDAGEYRPLKTAPNLRHGWRLELDGFEALCLALEFFYPAALGVRAAFREDRLEIVPLRETLGRQTGMYAVTKNVSDEEADQVAGECCRSGGGCLKSILWEIGPGRPLLSLPPRKFDPGADQLEPAASSPGETAAFPLLCNEACNLLVAAIRAAVKKNR